jgi:hypothetical protein
VASAQDTVGTMRAPNSSGAPARTSSSGRTGPDAAVGPPATSAGPAGGTRWIETLSTRNTSPVTSGASNTWKSSVLPAAWVTCSTETNCQPGESGMSTDSVVGPIFVAPRYSRTWSRAEPAELSERTQAPNR